MAEEPGELTKDTGIDPVARAAGASRDSDAYMERYGDTAAPKEMVSADGTSDQPEETEHIKAQIEETRNQLGETIDAIQERLSFANVSEQVSEQVSQAFESAKDSAYEATIGKAVGFMKNLGEDISETRAFKTVQSNPFPLVLIGIGAGLLAYQSYGRGKRPIRGLGKFEGRSYGKEQTRAIAGRTDTAGADSMATRAYDSVSDTAGTAYSSVTGAAGSAYEAVSGAVGNVYSGAGEAVNRAYKSAGELGSKAQEQYEYYIEENPLAIGAVAAALGAAVGFAIPSTRYEGQLMGEARHSVMGKAQSAVGDLIEQAKRVASEAGKTIKDETRSLAQ